MCMALWVYAICIWMPAEIRRLRLRLGSPKFGVIGLWVLGAKLGSCTMTGSCLNHWAISSASIHQLLWVRSDWLLEYMNYFYIFYKYEEGLIVRWKWPVISKVSKKTCIHWIIWVGYIAETQMNWDLDIRILKKLYICF